MSQPNRQNTSTTQGQGGGSQGGGYKSMSPEEVRERMKTQVSKGLAAATGSIEGYVDYTDPQAFAEASRKAAMTVRRTSEAVREETSQGLPGEPVMQRSSSSGGKDQGEFTSTMQGPGTGEQLKQKGQQLGEQAKQKGQQVTQQAKQKSQQMRQRSRQSLQETGEFIRGHSPQEIRQEMRNRVGRAMAAASGAAEGVAENTEPDIAERAVHRTAEAVRETTKAVREEVQQMRGGSARSGTGSVPQGTERESVGQPNVPVGDARYGEQETTYERSNLRTARRLDEREEESERR